MAKSDPDVVVIPRRRFERIIREAKKTSVEFKERAKELDRRWEEMEERHRREDRRRSY